MQVLQWEDFLATKSPLGTKRSALTIGVFDGVHRGHQTLIKSVVSYSADTVPIVVTFQHNSHKRKAAGGHPYLGDISSPHQKFNLFQKLGVSLTIVIGFSESFMSMSGKEFLHILQNHAAMSFMTVGDDFHCGRGRDTNALMLKELNAQVGIATTIVQPITEGLHRISSSAIRAAITQGDLSAASAMLGYPFAIDLKGTEVVSGKNGAAYDIAGQARILPPSGRYEALVMGKDGAAFTKTAACIRIEGGKLAIEEHTLDTKTCPQYVAPGKRIDS